MRKLCVCARLMSTTRTHEVNAVRRDSRASVQLNHIANNKLLRFGRDGNAVANYKNLCRLAALLCELLEFALLCPVIDGGNTMAYLSETSGGEH